MKWRGAYVSTKFALEGLTQTLRLEMQDTPIHVSLIQPGPITSDIRQNSIPILKNGLIGAGRHVQINMKTH